MIWNMIAALLYIVSGLAFLILFRKERHYGPRSLSYLFLAAGIIGLLAGITKILANIGPLIEKIQ